MRTVYNRIAGQNLERLAALSDGIFAVALTLLVLNLHVPVSTALAPIRSELDLWNAIILLLPSLLTYFMSFLTLGIFWVGQQTQLNNFVRGDRDLAWVHLVFLLAVTLTPFSTALLAGFITFRIALILYWFNIFLLGATLFAGWQYATHAGLVKDDLTGEMRSAISRRIIIAQALYAFGALLCIINTTVSIVFIVIVQLNYVIAPRIRPLYRL
jgi:uncharacterized membrane protein